MSTSTVVYSFDDSPVKLLPADVLLESDPSTQIRELSDQLLTKLQLEEACKEGTTLVAMKAPGFGNKPLKRWVKKLEAEFDGKPSGMDDAMFWKDYFLYWKEFKGFNPKLLAVSDVLETLQMRLTSFYDDDYFMGILRQNLVSFGPFEEGMTTLSYQNIIWYMSKLTADDEWCTWAMEWCTWAMGFAERKYLQELIAKGYDLPSHEIDEAAHKLRKDAILYFTKLKAASQRNGIAHVFSNAIEQRVYTRELMGNKNRTLCNFLKMPVDAEKKRNLLAILESLSDLSKIPGGLGALTTALPMQIFFLKKLLS